MEYRYYEIPAGSPVLALLGDKWVQNYGREIDYLHFHNHLNNNKNILFYNSFCERSG